MYNVLYIPFKKIYIVTLYCFSATMLILQDVDFATFNLKISERNPNTLKRNLNVGLHCGNSMLQK